MLAAVLSVLAIFCLAVWVFAANRYFIPAAFSEADFAAARSPEIPANGEISIVTWNIGYGGMGEESDFVMDLGQQTRPLSKALVDRNMSGIARRTASFDADVVFLQEAARPSWNTYRRDVLGAVESKLPGYGMTFGADIDTRYVPPPFNVEIGNAIFSRLAVKSAERRGLPLEPTFEYGAFRKGYRMHILRLAGPQEWVLINVHLSAFDSENDNVREHQVSTVLEFAVSEFSAGRHVVVGGDWNLRLAATEFPHRTEEKYQFWIRDFSRELTPDRWKWGVDPSVPTVRTAHKPYVEGENYRLIVDGYLVSPNVTIEAVEAIDLGFQFSDHNPVQIRLRAHAPQ